MWVARPESSMGVVLIKFPTRLRGLGVPPHHDLCLEHQYFFSACGSESRELAPCHLPKFLVPGSAWERKLSALPRIPPSFHPLSATPFRRRACNALGYQAEPGNQEMEMSEES